MKILKLIGYFTVGLIAGYFAGIEFFQIYQTTGDVYSALAAWIGIMIALIFGMWFHNKRNTAKEKNETD